MQDQRNNQVVGGHFVLDFAGGQGHTMNVATRNDGTASFAAPPTGYNDHFWQGSRGTYRDGDVDGVYVQMDMRVTNQTSMSSPISAPTGGAMRVRLTLTGSATIRAQA